MKRLFETLLQRTTQGTVLAVSLAFIVTVSLASLVASFEHLMV